MIEAKVEGDWRKKLQGLIDELKLAQGTDAVIKPTKVLYELSRMKGKALLGEVSRSIVDRVKAEMVPYVEKAIVGHKEGWEQRVGVAYRRWAYRFVEELYVAVRDARGWGPVQPSTLASKAAELAREAAARAEARRAKRAEQAAQPRPAEARRPRRPRGPRKPRQPSTRLSGAATAPSFGVRHTKPDWRQIQKGKLQAGEHRPEQRETEALIVVMVNGRVVSRG